MRKEFQVTHVTRSGRFYVIGVTESGVPGAVARELLVHRNNMPKADPIGTGQFTKFSGRVPIRDGFEGRHPQIVEGQFEEKDGNVSGQISIEVEWDVTSTKPVADSDDPDAFSILRPMRAAT